jgi:hypothetical protein
MREDVRNDVFAMGATVCETKADERSSLKWYRLVVCVFAEQGKRGVCFGSNASVENAGGEESSCL